MKTRKQAVKELRNANKESKSFFGVCKVIKSFWTSGYDEAFRYFGLEFEDFHPKKCTEILNRLQKDEDGNVFVWRKQYLKHGDNFLLDREGKRVFIWIQKPVTLWTAQTLWTICEQSKEGALYTAQNINVQKCIGNAPTAEKAEVIEYAEIIG
jgi:hypothetical protein